MVSEQDRELQTRVADHKSKLIDRLVQIAGQSGRDDARGAIKSRLHQLAEIIRLGVDDWRNIDDITRAKLTRWLEDGAIIKTGGQASLDSWEDEGGAVPVAWRRLDATTAGRLRPRDWYPLHTSQRLGPFCIIDKS